MIKNSTKTHEMKHYVELMVKLHNSTEHDRVHPYEEHIGRGPHHTKRLCQSALRLATANGHRG